MNLAWIPNAITLARMTLAAPLSWAILAERHELALALAFVAGASDAIDGWLAKHMRWQSHLGGLLDPIADKLMLTAAFVSLGVAGAVPMAMVALVLGRDLVIVAGAIAYHMLIGPLEAHPTRLSKLTTLLQILLVLALLTDSLAAVSLPPRLLDATLWLAAVVTLASGVHYVIAWSLKARRAWQRRSAARG
jgi:cardiolipin synthase